MTRVQRPNETDIAGIVALNNSFAPRGLTLPRTDDFVYAHLADYRVVRDADGGILACAGLDEYSPSIAEIISLAVSENEQGLGHGKALIAATERLARTRGYQEVFSVSYSDDLFLACGFEHTPLTTYPEKITRYEKIDRSELKVGEKHCFRKRLKP